MLAAAQVQQLLDSHQQLRPFSCFQSAVEMVLKLYSVIPANAFPEQNIVANDGRGYEPFAGKRKHYGATEIEFIEEKFEPFTAAAVDRGRALLNEGIYPIYSFRWPTGGFHGFVGFRNEAGELEFITKDKVGSALAKRYARADLMPHQAKTEILIVRIVPPAPLATAAPTP